MTLPSGGEFRETIRARIKDAERIARDARDAGDETVARSADQIAAEWRALLQDRRWSLIANFVSVKRSDPACYPTEPLLRKQMPPKQGGQGRKKTALSRHCSSVNSAKAEAA